jgi:hypothetical protein
MTQTEAGSKQWMPSRAAEFLCRQTERLVKGKSLTPAECQRIYDFCGVRPDYPQWRRFLVPLLSLLGLLSLVAAAVFFVAWNWADMPKMAKFALAELLVVALTVVVWWRWYDGLARSALLAAALSFGALVQSLAVCFPAFSPHRPTEQFVVLLLVACQSYLSALLRHGVYVPDGQRGI